MSVPEYRPDGDYEEEDSIPLPEDGGEVRSRKDEEQCRCCRVVNFHLLQFYFSFGALPLLMMNLSRWHSLLGCATYPRP